jgi:hypothetical protein
MISTIFPVAMASQCRQFPSRDEERERLGKNWRRRLHRLENWSGLSRKPTLPVALSEKLSYHVTVCMKTIYAATRPFDLSRSLIDHRCPK